MIECNIPQLLRSLTISGRPVVVAKALPHHILHSIDSAGHANGRARITRIVQLDGGGDWVGLDVGWRV